MKSVCKIYSNNPEPNHLVLYLDKDLKEIFRIEFAVTDKNKVFEKKYEEVCRQIQTNSPALWEKLDAKKTFRKSLRICEWIETTEAECIPLKSEDISK